jgi:hypothetical protein
MAAAATYAIGAGIATTTTNDYQVLLGVQGASLAALIFVLASRVHSHSHSSISLAGLWVWTLALGGSLIARLISLAINRGSAINRAAKFRRWDAAVTTVGYAAALAYLGSTLFSGRRHFGVTRYLELAGIGVPAATALSIAFVQRTPDDIDISYAAALSMQSYTTPTLTDAETDTRVLIVESPDNDNEDVWIAFAGTASRKNVRTDLSVADAALFPGEKMRVHSGFLNAWMSVRDRVLAAASASGRVYVVGHSMGGALATLAAMEISGVSGASVACVTFGAPAVGDELFADAFNSRVGQSVRVVNALDPIPRSLSSQFAQTRGLLLVSSTSLNVHSMDAYAVSVDATRAVRLLSMLAPVLVVSLAMTMMSRK